MAFRIYVDRFLGELGEIGLRFRENKFSHCFEIGIEIDRTNERFEGIGQSRVTLPSTARFLAAPHH